MAWLFSTPGISSLSTFSWKGITTSITFSCIRDQNASAMFTWLLRISFTFSLISVLHLKNDLSAQISRYLPEEIASFHKL
jgi:hypothetical protein